MIELESVVKSYGGRPVVDGVSLRIGRGELWALVGSSGSGKSTTLKMINRLIPMTAGSIRIDGSDILTVPVEALRRRIGYAIQSVGLFPHRTVEDNIATVPRLLKWPAGRIRDRVTLLLELFRLDPATTRGKYPDQLSGGQQQRVGVARALAADPDIVLMDEPFGALDPITRDELQSELARIHRATGKTIIMVTHDMEEAIRLAGGIAIMRQGRIVQAGAPAEILDRPADAFVQEFVGGPRRGLSLLSVRLVRDRLRPGEAAVGDPIPADLPLRDALSLMVVRHVDRLPVMDGEGRAIGAVVLADLVA
jgi:osmoprotectant transport system ATP-binding protein